MEFNYNIMGVHMNNVLHYATTFSYSTLLCGGPHHWTG